MFFAPPTIDGKRVVMMIKNMSPRRSIPKFQLVFLLTLSLHSCGKQIDPELAPYVNDFISLAASSGIELSNTKLNVEFGVLAAPNKGICKKNSAQITMDREHWISLDNESKRWLMYHELGHCLGNLDHDSNFFSDGDLKHPVTIMYPGASVALGRYDKMRFYYDTELMNRMKGTQ